MTDFNLRKGEMVISFTCDEELPVSPGEPVTVEREFATVTGIVVNSWPLLDGWHQYIIEVL